MRTTEHEQTSPLQIDVSAEGAVVMVTVFGELDITTAAPLSRRLLAIGDGHPGQLVLDLGRLVFADAAGTRALEETYQALEAECPVILRQPRRPQGLRASLV
jgi:anti-anti-sigma factor